MTDTLYEAIPELTEPVKLYLKKLVELRKAFDTYTSIQGDLDAVWGQLPEKVQYWLAHLDHHEYKKLRESVSD